MKAWLSKNSFVYSRVNKNGKKPKIKVMKKLVLVLVVLVSTMVQGSNGVIPGKGTGDRVLIEDTFEERKSAYLKEQQMKFFKKNNIKTQIPSSKSVTYKNDEDRIISQLKEEGYSITDVERLSGASAYLLERETSYSFCAVSVTFYKGKLYGQIVKQCL